MNAVHFRTLPKRPLCQTFVAFLLISFLTACGTISPTNTSSAQPQIQRTTTKPTNTSLSLNLNPVNISAKIGNLLIQSRNGFQCPYASPDASGDIDLGHLVLASNRTTYSQAEIAQMRVYLTSLENDRGNVGALKSGTELPPTLRWVLGGETIYIPGTPIAAVMAPGADCHATLTLANTGNTPIEVANVGVQLQARPQQNTYQYRLIDACSLKIPYCPPTGEAGGGDCSIYSASIQLGPGKQNDVFSAVPRSATGCSTLTIPPAAQVSLDLAFSPATNVPQNLIYSIVPVFTVDTTQGEQSVALPQLASTLAFASASQFSCYGLQGTTFVLVKSPKFEPNPSLGQNWCA